jgi:3-phosphoshikimate 1-carboxyvinyltransferase
MIATIHPSALRGLQQAPPSKSDMQRACAAALIHRGTTTLYNPGSCNDDLAALEVIRQLGATVTQENNTVIIRSQGVNATGNQLHCGESGLGIRMFTPIAALNTTPITITGQGSLTARPMDFFDAILPQLGVSIRSNEGRLPLEIHGPLQPRNITIDGSLSSQFLTGLLMAYAASGTAPVTITVTNLKSRPYIDLTLQVMQAFGLEVPENKDYETFTFHGTGTPAAAVDYTIDGDWSGAAFLLVAGAIAGSVEVKGLQTGSVQGDKKILEALELAGASVTFHNGNIQVSRKTLRPFVFDATDCPDLFPPLVALASVCKGQTVIKGLGRLKHKESDRGITLQEEFARLGIEILLQEDEMTINGRDTLTVINPQLHSRHDHRIAMAAAVAGLVADQPITITDAEAINKSYPTFFQHLQHLGAPVEYGQ